eukprot:152171_1
MAVWKGAIAVTFGCLLSYITHKWEYTQKHHILKLIPLLPGWLALIRKLKPGSIIDRAIVSAGHCVYHSVIALLLSKWIPFEYGVLCIYLPLPLVFERKSFGLSALASHNDIFYKYYIQLFWSLPIISSMKLLSNIYKTIIPIVSIDTYIKHGIHSPMISIITDDICVGRIPLNAFDVNIIIHEPYNIGGIINMCLESDGQINEYKKYGIKYVNYKTVDTLPPRLNDILLAMEFIEDFVIDKDNAINENNIANNKRILIHCRGGRSRSATIALCWLIKCGMNVKDAIQLLSKQREAIHPKIQFYDVVYKFSETVARNVIKPQKIKRVLSYDW